jgi:hypothetical protein
MLTLSGRPMPGVVADHLILALPLREPDQVQPARAGVMADVRGEPLSHRQHQRRRDEPVPAVLAEEPVMPCPYCSRGCRIVSIIRSMQRTSSLT